MEIYVARQPIFNTRLQVVAYELLYRSGSENSSSFSDGDCATSSVISNGLMSLGINELTEGKKSFINFTKNLILDKIPVLFSKDIIVVEILEDIVPNDEFIDACRDLKSRGYTIALDDFVLDYNYIELIEIADIIKIDFLSTTRKERRKIISLYRNLDVKFLAEKVESLEDFEEAKENGYSYFQGYFFSKPVIIPGKDITSQVGNYIEIMDELNSSSPEYNKISNIIERDVSLTYKLMRLINSPAFYTNSRITSISHALVLLGFSEIRKWITIIMMRDLGSGKTDEIVRLSLLRAKMCELTSVRLKMRARKNEMFLVGIFSMLDTLMNRSLFDVLSEIPLEIEIIRAILGYDNELREVFDLVLAYEKGQWGIVKRICSRKNIEISDLFTDYQKSIEWIKDIYNS